MAARRRASDSRVIDECASLICQTSREIALNLLERTFELRGPEGLGAKPRPELIGPLFTHLHDTLQDAVRMGFLHSSRARGRIPGSLRAAAEVRYLGHSAGGDDATLLHFEVPTFASVAAELFGQQLLWDDGPKPEETAFELLGAAVNDVRQRRTESNRFDPPLLAESAVTGACWSEAWNDSACRTLRCPSAVRSMWQR